MHGAVRTRQREREEHELAADERREQGRCRYICCKFEDVFESLNITNCSRNRFFFEEAHVFFILKNKNSITGYVRLL